MPELCRKSIGILNLLKNHVMLSIVPKETKIISIEHLQVNQFVTTQHSKIKPLQSV